EIYKMAMGLPGAIVEFGVFKGTSLVRWANFREVLENPMARKIIGFDAFGEFPRTSVKEDDDFARKHDTGAGHGISKDELSTVLQHKNLRNIELVAGDLLKTLPSYLETHPELRVSLLHIDVDVYTPTKLILEQIYSRVVEGGLIVLDDYSHIAGETRAA